jgi:hypothetical protein
MGDAIYMFTLDDAEQSILSHGDTAYHNWFTYKNRTKNIFPLYNYYDNEYNLSQLFTLGENINPINLIFLHIRFNFLNIYDYIYSYLYYDFYSLGLIINNVIKYLFILFSYIYIKNITKIYYYYAFKKISIEFFRSVYKFKTLIHK